MSEIGSHAYNATRVREIREERECGLVEAKRISKGEDLEHLLDRIDPSDPQDQWRLINILKEVVKDLYRA